LSFRALGTPSLYPVMFSLSLCPDQLAEPSPSWLVVVGPHVSRGLLCSSALACKGGRLKPGSGHCLVGIAPPLCSPSARRARSRLAFCDKLVLQLLDTNKYNWTTSEIAPPVSAPQSPQILRSGGFVFQEQTFASIVGWLIMNYNPCRNRFATATVATFATPVSSSMPAGTC
jgi:hypothetical protein